MNFKTIETGSGGNCFLIDDEIIIDVGLPYSKIKPYLELVGLILLTHKHGDHFKIDTIRKIAVNHEHITFVCGEWLKDKLMNILSDCQIKVLDFGEIVSFNEYKIAMIEAYHDVANCGYRIMVKGHRHLHITDTVTLDGIEAIGYDSASIECNHEINKALELIQEAKENDEFSHLKGAINSHLAVHKTIEFCKENGIKKLYPVHIGSSTKKEVIQALREWINT